MIYPVILSGGAGTRLWPLSRAAMPKQLQALHSDLSMLQETVGRVASMAKATESHPVACPPRIKNVRRVPGYSSATEFAPNHQCGFPADAVGHFQTESYPPLAVPDAPGQPSG